LAQLGLIKKKLLRPKLPFTIDHNNYFVPRIIVLKFEKIPFSAKNRVIMHKQTATDINSQMQKQTAFILVP